MFSNSLGFRSFHRLDLRDDILPSSLPAFGEHFVDRWSSQYHAVSQRDVRPRCGSGDHVAEYYPIMSSCEASGVGQWYNSWSGNSAAGGEDLLDPGV